MKNFFDPSLETIDLDAYLFSLCLSNNYGGWQEHDKTFDSIKWGEVTPPTESEFDSKLATLTTEYNAIAYKKKRAADYDSVGNQLDMLMKDMRDGTKTHQESCEAVKAQFPKPT